MGTRKLVGTAKSFDVRVGESLVGHLVQRQDYVVFTWAEDYWSLPDRPILGLQFENDRRSVRSSALRLPPWFSNLLPEGVLRTWIARQRGVSPQREMELLAQVGHDLPGAVTVVPSGNRIDGPQMPAVVAEAPPGGVAPEIKFSLAGVQLKMSMLKSGDRLTLPASGRGDWIVKLPDASFPHVPLNEYAMMSWADRAGIAVPQIRLLRREELPVLPDVAWPNNEALAFAVERFDRTPSGAIHVEDFAQVRGFYPDDKYRGAWETVAALCFRAGADEASLEEFVRRITFNVLVGNGDAHLKNWSLQYVERTRPRLSPAYDLVSTFVYAEAQGRHEDLGLRWANKKLFERVTSASLAVLQERLGARVDLPAVAEAVARNMQEHWPSVREEHLRGDEALAGRLDAWFTLRLQQFL